MTDPEFEHVLKGKSSLRIRSEDGTDAYQATKSPPKKQQKKIESSTEIKPAAEASPRFLSNEQVAVVDLPGRPLKIPSQGDVERAPETPSKKRKRLESLTDIKSAAEPSPGSLPNKQAVSAGPPDSSTQGVLKPPQYAPCPTTPMLSPAPATDPLIQKYQPKNRPNTPTPSPRSSHSMPPPPRPADLPHFKKSQHNSKGSNKDQDIKMLPAASALSSSGPVTRSPKLRIIYNPGMNDVKPINGANKDGKSSEHSGEDGGDKNLAHQIIVSESPSQDSKKMAIAPQKSSKSENTEDQKDDGGNDHNKHPKCDYCVDRGRAHLPQAKVWPEIYRTINSEKAGMSSNRSQVKEQVKEHRIEGPLTREILHLRKGSSQVITTIIEFTDEPGNDSFHAFIDRAEEDAYNAEMPKTHEPTKVIVTWDNGRQLRAIRRGLDGSDRFAIPTLIRTTQDWRSAIRVMRKKLYSNQNWTIWWMEKREETDDENNEIFHDESRGIFHDTGSRRAYQWCMPKSPQVH